MIQPCWTRGNRVRSVTQPYSPGIAKQVSHYRVFPGSAIVTGKERGSFIVAGDGLPFAVPLNAATDLVADHPEETQVCGEMTDFSIGDGTAGAVFDTLDEITPERRNVVTVLLIVKLRVFVNGGAPVRRIKGPAVPPAHVESAFVSVKIAAHPGFLSVVSAEAAMLPDCGEGFKLVGRDLMIRCVRSLLCIGQDRSPPHGTPPVGVDPLRLFLVGPPENLVEPVHPPVAEGSVREVEEVAEAAGMDPLVERSHRGRTAIEIPVEVLRDRLVGGRGFKTSPAMGEGADHADGSRAAFPEKFHAADMMRTDAAMHPDLHDAVGGFRRFDKSPALADGMPGRLFDENVSACRNAGDSLKGVPVVRGGNNHNLELFLLQHLAVVAVHVREGSGESLDFVCGNFELIGIDITERDDIAAAVFNRDAEDIHSPPTRSDQRGFVFFSGLGLCLDPGSKAGSSHHGGSGSEKMTTIKTLGHGDQGDFVRKLLHAVRDDATYVNRIMKIAFYDAKPYDEEFFNRQNSGNELEFAYHEFRLRASTAVTANGADAVCVFVNDEVDRACLEALSENGVRLVALRCAGFNNVDYEAASEIGIPVVRVPAYSPHAVAEHAIALLSTLNRRIHRAYNRVRELNFSLNGLVGIDLHGKTVGIIGTGKIGKLTAQIFRGFGCRVIAYDLYPDESWAVDFGIRYKELDEIYEECDVLSLHTPLTPETHHMINEESVAKMKKHPIIVNTSRGKLIDTTAVISALKEKKLRGVALDVYEIEEGVFFEDLSHDVLQDDELARLLTFNNVLITSHQGFLTEEALGEISRVTCENFRALAAGKPFLEGTEVEP